MISTATAPKVIGSAQSRSTSAGSSTSAGPAEAFPDINYPVPFIVKNTFLDEAWQPSSLDGFLQERVTRSCVSRLEAYPVGTCPPGPMFLSKTSIVTEDGEFYDAVDEMPATPWAVSPLPFQCARPLQSTIPRAPQAHAGSRGQELECSAAKSASFVLHLSDMIPEAGLAARASPASAHDIELPTKGSAGHFDGTCKPCAFFHTKGCRQGPECEFCHLCEPGERKRRRKEKVTLMKQQRAMQNMDIQQAEC